MSENPIDDGVIVALVERFRNFRLPRAMEIEQRVDRGETLTDGEIDFLKRVFDDATQVQRGLLGRNPELKEVAAKAIHLYHEITQKALENEEHTRP